MSNDKTITRETVAHVASLSRITLTEEETDTLTTQLGSILNAITKVGGGR